MAEQLAADGHRVAAVFARDTESASRLGVEADRHEWAITTVQADVTDPEACARVAEQVLEQTGRIDYLINNAGAMRDGPVTSLATDDWDEVVSVNLSSAFYMTRSVLPAMIDNGFGRIVMIGSAAGVTGSPARPNYSAAKAGLIGFTNSLAHGYSRKGVTANLIVVGPTEAGIGETIGQEDRAKLVARMPLGRPVHGDEVVHAVRFLLDERAGAVTGSTVTVDGGMTM
jgi:acetoacetyl-CoA reductase